MTKKIEDGGPAFPHMAADGHPDYRFGLSLRDWFAGKVLACGDWSDSDVREISDEDLVAMCQQVYRIADAMLAARKSGGEP